MEGRRCRVENGDREMLEAGQAASVIVSRGRRLGHGRARLRRVRIRFPSCQEGGGTQHEMDKPGISEPLFRPDALKGNQNFNLETTEEKNRAIRREQGR